MRSVIHKTPHRNLQVSVFYESIVNNNCLVRFKRYNINKFAMSNDQKFETLQKYKPITDTKIIAELDKLPLYIPQNETDETYDNEILSGQGNDLGKSSDNVGQLRSIEVSVWFDDPEKESTNSIERIHMRIINGRHRYRVNPNWKRQYYDFSEYAKSGEDPFVEYYFAKGHFDMQKKSSKEERAIWVRGMCEHAMTKLRIKAVECCNWVIKEADKQGISSANAIREVCPKEFKDPVKKGREGMTFEKTGKIEKLKKVSAEKFAEVQGIKLRLETENTKLEKENIGLHEQANETQRVMADIQQQLRLVANIEHEEKCKCGRVTKIKVDATSGKVIISENAGTGKVVISEKK